MGLGKDLIEWLEDPESPRTEHNTIPMYHVSWESRSRKGKPRRAADWFTSQATAERVYCTKRDAGLNPTAKIKFIAGWL